MLGAPQPGDETEVAEPTFSFTDWVYEKFVNTTAALDESEWGDKGIATGLGEGASIWEGVDKSMPVWIPRIQNVMDPATGELTQGTEQIPQLQLKNIFEHIYHSPVVGGIMKVVARGLMKPLGQGLLQGAYMVERGIGAVSRRVPWVEGLMEYGLTPGLAQGEYQTRNEWLEEEFPGRLREAQRAATEMDRIAYSTLNDDEKFKKGIRRIMEGETPDEVVKDLEDPMTEMLLQAVLDPLNLLSALGGAGIRANRLSREVEAASGLTLEGKGLVPALRRGLEKLGVDTKLRPTGDLGELTYMVTGVGRTNQSRVTKVGEIAADLGRQIVADSKDPIEAMAVLQGEWPSRLESSVHGQLVRKALEDLDPLVVRRRAEAAYALTGDPIVMHNEIGQVLKAHARRKVAGVLGEGGWLESLTQRADAISYGGTMEIGGITINIPVGQKRLLAPLFLGYNGPYPINNFFDNNLNIVWDAGIHYMGEGFLSGVKKGMLRPSSWVKDYYLEELGFIPERALKGFKQQALVPPEQLEEAAQLEKLRGLRQKVAETLSVGPTLQAAEKIEADSSALAFYVGERRAWDQLWRHGRGLRPMPPGTRAALLAASGGNEQLVHNLERLPLGHRRFDHLMHNVEGIFYDWVNKPGEGTIKGMGWYTSRLPAEVKEGLREYESVSKVLDQLPKADTEAKVRVLIRRAKDIIDEDARKALQAADAIDARRVGWAWGDLEAERGLAMVGESRFRDQPQVMQILKNPDATPADIAYALHQNGYGQASDYFIPLDDREVELITKGTTPDKLMAYWTTRNPEIKEFQGIWREEDYIRDIEANAPSILEHLGEQARPTPQARFWQSYFAIHPNSARALKEDPRVQRVLRLGMRHSDSPLWEDAWKATQEFMEKRPGALMDSETAAKAEVWRRTMKKYYTYKTHGEKMRMGLLAELRVGERPYRTWGPDAYERRRFITEKIRPALDKLETWVLNDLGRVPEEALPIDRAGWEIYRDWLKTEVKNDMIETHYATIRGGLAVRDFAILNYGDRTYADAFLQVLFPYQFWGTHSAYNWGIRTADNPAILAQYSRLQYSLHKNNKEIPRRLQDFMPFPWAQPLKRGFEDGSYKWEGNLYWLPQQQLIRYPQLPGWNTPWLPDSNNEYDRGQTFGLVSGHLSLTPFAKMPLIGLAKVFPKLPEDMQDAIKPHLPPAAQLNSGPMLPLTRAIRASSLLFQGPIEQLTRGTVRVPPEGLNPEGWFWDLLDGGRTSPIEEYWTDRWIASMVGAGVATADMGWQAMTERKGALYAKARHAAAQQKSVRQGPLSWVFPLKVLPDPEMEMRGKYEMYKKARDAYASGKDRTALAGFYQQYPEWNIWNAAADAFNVHMGYKDRDKWIEEMEAERRYTQYNRRQYELQNERRRAQALYVPGSPDYWRIREYYRNSLANLRDEYQDSIDKHYEILTQRQKSAKNWQNYSKAKAVQNFVSKWFQADEKARTKMFNELPHELAEAARYSAEDKPYVTQLDVMRWLAAYDDPIDATYRGMADVARPLYDKYGALANKFPDLHPEFEQEYNEYMELEYPDTIDYREKHPDFYEKYSKYREDISKVWQEKLVFDESYIQKILLLHPDWRDTEKETELRQVVKDLPEMTLDDWQARKKTDRGLAINLLWRYWTSLPSYDKSQDRKHWKEVAGPAWDLFLAGEYSNVDDFTLGIWMRMMPTVSDYKKRLREPLGQLSTPRGIIRAEEEFLGFKFIGPEPAEAPDTAFSPRDIVRETKAKGFEALDSAERAIARSLVAERKLAAAETAPEVPIEVFKVMSPEEAEEYQRAYELYQKALNGKREYYSHPLVKKYFPPGSPAAKFWDYYYNSIPPGKLGAWARDKALIGAILDTSSRKLMTDEVFTGALEWLMANARKHEAGDPREYAQARRENEEFWALLTPELEPVFNVYKNLKKRADKRDFIQQHPELQALFEAWDDYKASHPIYVKYYDPDWKPRDGEAAGAAGAGAGAGGGGRGRGGGGGGGQRVGWNQVKAQMGPLLLGELVQYWTGKGTLSNAARKRLKSMKPSGMSMTEWLNMLKQWFILYGARNFVQPRPMGLSRRRGGGGGQRPIYGGGRWMIRH